MHNHNAITPLDEILYEYSREIKSVSVQIGARRMQTQWSVALEQDLMAIHGINIESEMIAAMTHEIQAEIDREMISRMVGDAQL